MRNEVSKGVRMFGGVGILAAILLTACDPEMEEPDLEEPTEEPEEVDPRDLDYDPELGVDFDEMEEREGNLFFRDVEEGDGEEAEHGHSVQVHYTGALPDGSVFDSSPEGNPFTFTLGAGEVIPGWDEGVQGMREGGTRLLVIPPHLAYGEAGAGEAIPPGSTLVFEVELLEVL